MSLKQKALSGLLWSFIESISGLGISFVVGIILARILSPEEFGLIGMITVFIGISQSCIDSGFSQALIRKQNCTPEDFSTVFYYNIFIGTLLYFILFFSAQGISDFYDEPILRDLLRVLGLGLVINSFSIIQTTILKKNLDFKLQTKISIIASILSGTIGIYMALSGMGVWSLVTLFLIKNAINLSLLWIWQKWKPSWVFNKKSFKELFSFGSKLFLSGLIDSIFRNIYYLIIGKFYSAIELGYYTKADQFKSLPSINIQTIIARVSYPILSTMQNDIPRLKEAYKKLIRSTMLITQVLMLGMVAVARPMVLTLIGETWEPTIVYLQLLCLVGIFYPLHALNLSMLKVIGRSDLFLRLAVIKNTLMIPVIIVGIKFGIIALIIGLIANNVIAYFLNSYWSGRLIGYSMFDQIKDVIPSLTLASCMAIVVYIEGLVIVLPHAILLAIQVLSGILLIFGTCELTHFRDYFYIKNILIVRIQNRSQT